MNKILSMTKDIEKSFKSQNRLTVVAVAGSLLFALVVGVYALTAKASFWRFRRMPSFRRMWRFVTM